jgi:Protein of unknown function (DUF4238)
MCGFCACATARDGRRSRDGRKSASISGYTWKLWLAVLTSKPMPSNKNQHFVPRCHLKPFTAGCEGTVINIYNIDRGCGIRSAPVKGQCSRNYFYGEDLRLKKWLQEIEGRYAQLIRNVTAPGYKLDETDKGFLRQFMFLQYSRTETAARRRAVATADMHNAVFSNSENPEKIDNSGMHENICRIDACD